MLKNYSQLSLLRRSEVVEKVHKQLASFLNSPDVQAAYDAVVIDTAPSKGPLDHQCD